MTIQELLQAIRQDDKTASEAALSLGLLIEREKVSRPAGDDGGISVLIGDEYRHRRLSEAEVETAVTGLTQYINETPNPHPMAVWALTKSYDPRILPVLAAMFDQAVVDPAQEQTAYQALVGITAFHNQQALAVIKKASQAKSDLIRETAKQYLDLFGTAPAKD
jgi:hypothetical protein